MPKSHKIPSNIYLKLGIPQMEIHTENDTIKRQNAIVAYLLAVTSATFTLILPHSICNIADILSGTGFESATGLPTITKLQHLLFMASIMFVIGWMFAFFTASIPFSVGITIARRLKISHWLYFVVGAILTAAVVLEPLCISI